MVLCHHQWCNLCFSIGGTFQYKLPMTTLISLVIVDFLSESQGFQAAPSFITSVMPKFGGCGAKFIFLVASRLLEQRRRSCCSGCIWKSCPMFWSMTDRAASPLTTPPFILANNIPTLFRYPAIYGLQRNLLPAQSRVDLNYLKPVMVSPFSLSEISFRNQHG